MENFVAFGKWKLGHDRVCLKLSFQTASSCCSISSYAFVLTIIMWTEEECFRLHANLMFLQIAAEEKFKHCTAAYQTIRDKLAMN